MPSVMSFSVDVCDSACFAHSSFDWHHLTLHDAVSFVCPSFEWGCAMLGIQLLRPGDAVCVVF
jgi:hypothetical protein